MISEYSIFYGTLLPSAYTSKRWVDREAREDERTAQHYYLPSRRAHTKRLELSVRIAVSRITGPPTTSRRQFCLPST